MLHDKYRRYRRIMHQIRNIYKVSQKMRHGVPVNKTFIYSASSFYTRKFCLTRKILFAQNLITGVFKSNSEQQYKAQRYQKPQSS